MDNILSVRELNQKLRQVLDIKFPFVWVKGEVTNCASPSSGHIYFSLKDGDDLLNCVWFRQNQKPQKFDPMTGEVWEDGPKQSIAHTLCDGQEIICAGRLTIYAPRGQYQLIVELAEQSGTGQLYATFEALKKKLATEGLFEAAHKKALPQKIKNIALITAPNGAVIKDFLRISKNRGMGSHIHLYPSLVQGEGASKMLIAALLQAQNDYFDTNKKKKADVIVLIRGGGSIQDLWAFNDEALARAIYACPIPIITGIGHEPDHSIADYVADISVATPSHAAQILWQERSVLIQRIDDIERGLSDMVNSLLYHHEIQLKHATKNLLLLSPQNKLKSQIEQTKNLFVRLQNAILRNYNFENMRTKNLVQLLKSTRPPIAHEKIKTENLQKELQRSFFHALEKKEQAWDALNKNLLAQENILYSRYNQLLENMALQLALHNPLAPLEKGYILVEAKAKDGKKTIVRSVDNVQINDKLCLNFQDGFVDTIAEKVYKTK